MSWGGDRALAEKVLTYLDLYFESRKVFFVIIIILLFFFLFYLYLYIYISFILSEGEELSWGGDRALAEKVLTYLDLYFESRKGYFFFFFFFFFNYYYYYFFYFLEFCSRGRRIELGGG